MLGDIPSCRLAMVMSLVRRHSLSIVTEVVEFVCLSITTTSMLRLTLAFLLVSCDIDFSCLLLLLAAAGSFKLDSELVSVFSRQLISCLLCRCCRLFEFSCASGICLLLDGLFCLLTGGGGDIE